MKFAVIFVLAGAGLALAKSHGNDIAPVEKLPNLKLPCDCLPANCPTFLSAKSVSSIEETASTVLEADCGASTDL